jgi:hypothetical protein
MTHNSHTFEMMEQVALLGQPGIDERTITMIKLATIVEEMRAHLNDEQVGVMIRAGGFALLGAGRDTTPAAVPNIVDGERVGYDVLADCTFCGEDQPIIHNDEMLDPEDYSSTGEASI